MVIMVSEVISFIILTAATIAASAIVTGYLATASSQTTARISEQTAKQVLMTSESITVVITYTCWSELCIDVMNNSGRQVGISYAYDGNTGSPVTYRLMDASGNTVPKLPAGAGTIALTPNMLTSAVLISENYVVYRIE
jgi:hypothetical protein